MPTEHPHSRPWEKLPQAVLNLLNLYSMHAFWDTDNPIGKSAWCVKRNGKDGAFVRVGDDTDIEAWVTAVKLLEEYTRRGM